VITRRNRRVTAHILDGKSIAATIRKEVASEVQRLADMDRRPKLAAVIVGQPHAGKMYAHSQEKLCKQYGIGYQLHQLDEITTESALCEHIQSLNRDPSVTGVVLLLPLPENINPSATQYCIDPYKDVEGVNPANVGFVFYSQPIIAPCAALAVVELIKHSSTQIRGAEAVVVGQGAVVGRPISLFLLHQMATVTGCHIATRDLAAHTRNADILVVAVGKPGLITADMVKPGAVVIDVGVNRIPSPDGGQRIVGDVDFDRAKEVAGAITPVPGGVGPLTVALLLRNTVEAARKQLHRTGPRHHH
jgi:methylenetetrahydrofolate dehydrogenase (NADP+)/methenyltetrahydrofolate cyclohydrolase